MNQLHIGQDLVCIGEIGTAGAGYLLRHHAERIRERFSESYLRTETERLTQYMTEAARAIQPAGWPEQRIKEYGITKYAHIGEGGILSALWNFCSEEGLDPETGRMRNPGAGCEFRYDRIPVRQFTMELCELFDLLPYRLHSDCFLAAADQGFRLCEALQAENIPAAVFGRITPGKKRLRTDGTEIAYLTNEHTEELAKLDGGIRRV